ncbi:MAG: site-specific DNA-methyltransferase [Dehalococcoidia bacterium]
MSLVPALATVETFRNQVICCDAMTLLRSLPSKSVDIVVTSPPYNIVWKTSPNHKSGMFRKDAWFLAFKDGYENHDDHMPEKEYQEWVKAVVGECMRVSKGLVWVNHKTRYRDGVGIHPLSFMPFPLWSEIVWNQGSGRGFNSRRFVPSHEYIFAFGRPHYWDRTNDTAFSVWHLPPQPRKEHPAPFPHALINPLIIASCPAGGIVLDPFMGSGTTAEVARSLGRDFMGCDNSETYVNLARSRLEHAYQPLLFDTITQEVN